MTLNSEELQYLKRLVKADVADFEEAGHKSSDLGFKLALEWRKKVLKKLQSMTQ